MVAFTLIFFLLPETKYVPLLPSYSETVLTSS